MCGEPGNHVRRQRPFAHVGERRIIDDVSIDTTDGRSLRTRLIDACDLDDVETRAGFRLAEGVGSL
jgi:hypothetical protein